MSNTKPLKLSISCHCWNSDRTRLALSPNNNTIEIWSASGTDQSKWVKTHTLTEHGGFVSGMDWNAENLLLTCAHDRNAYVWKEEGDSWKPTLVILRINRAATSCKWSPLGNKFAVTSGAKQVPVCYFEERNDWYVSKMIKKHRSTVLTLDWCPNNKFIVTGSTDFKCRVFSAFIEDLDASEDDGFGGIWQAQHEFGSVLAEFDQAKAWVNSVAWSPNGTRLAFAGHGSSLTFVHLVAGSDALVQTVPCKGKPFVCLDYLSDDTIIAAGFGANPTVFVNNGSDVELGWTFVERLDKEEKVEKKAMTNTKASMMKFKNLAKTGKTEKGPEMRTFHKNTISCLTLGPRDGGKVTTFTTSGLDGRVVSWDIAKVKGIDMAKLKL